MFEYVINMLKEKMDDGPQFIFGITMQNHSPYDYSEEVFTSTISLEGYKQHYPDVEQYLSLIHMTDSALQYLVKSLSEIDAPVVLLFYGDHYPTLNQGFFEEVHGGPFLTKEEQLLQYSVPFVIWTNYDIEEKQIELSSLNYLSNYLFEAAGIQLPAYNQILAEICEVIPAICAQGYYSAEKDCFFSLDEGGESELSVLNYYYQLEYNCIFDSEERSNVLFPVSG